MIRIIRNFILHQVLGRPDVAVAGQLRSFLGGNREAIERARPVVEAYSGGSIIVVGDKPAHANVVKLAANMVLAANISLFGQVYALNERWGVDNDITHQVLSNFSTHPGLLAYEARVRDRNYDRPNGEGFGVEGGLKDINAMVAAGDEVNVSLPFCNVMKEQFTKAIDSGLKDMDWSVLGDIPRINAGSSLPTQQKK